MKYLRDASQDEMICAFLCGEYGSTRFGNELRTAMRRVGCPEEYLLSARLDDMVECDVRRRVLAEYRDWGKNTGLFERFPDRVRWLLAQCEPSDLDAIRYIRYSYWDELSKWTGLARQAAQSVREGHKVFGVSNAAFVEGAELLRAGGTFAPMIALYSAAPRVVLLEGHSRLTVYALAPERFEGALCYMGWCARAALDDWAGTELCGAPDGYCDE